MVQKPGPQEQEVCLRSDRMSFEVPWQSHEDLDGCEMDQWAASRQLYPLKHLKEQSVRGGGGDV